MYKLAFVTQGLVLIEDEIRAPPNLSEKTTTAKPPKLLDQVRDTLRVKHDSIYTRQNVSVWIKRYIFFPGKLRPKNRGPTEVECFLMRLAKVAASTQSQARSALLFPYREARTDALSNAA